MVSPAWRDGHNAERWARRSISRRLTAKRDGATIRPRQDTRLDVDRFIDDVKRARMETESQEAVEDVLQRRVHSGVCA
jgi:hypothetical protein